MTEKPLAEMIDQGQGVLPADLVLKGGAFYDLVTGVVVPSDIALCGDRVVGTCADYAGREEIDITGKVVVPGFVDTHLHVESSLVTPLEFDRCVLPHGVTTGICDPHEIANVLGLEGLDYFLECAGETLMDLRVQLSSCVPASHLETSGATLGVEDLLPLKNHPRVLGLAEFMNYPGVLKKDSACMAKLEAFRGCHVDGHAPLLRGKPLNGYLSAGIRTDHEVTEADEALEKLRKGMHVLIREGSVSKDLEALLPILTERHSPFLALCTDDRNPLDIAEEGHLDHMIRSAIAGGADRLAVYRAATLSGARAFGLRDRGLVAPGWLADLVILDDLDRCAVAGVIRAGRPVDDARFAERRVVPPVGRRSVRVPTIGAGDFALPMGEGAVPVIGVQPGRIITALEWHHPTRRYGRPVADPIRDLLKVAVIERHGKHGGMGRGFVRGFGLNRGAIASTVGHDSHNLCVLGADDGDMALAVNRLAEIEGGLIVVAGGEVRAELPLPLAGLMSLEPHEVVRDQLAILRKAAKDLGTGLDEPFLQLAFLALPVIPHLKITDRGLVDVDRFALLS